MSTKAIDKLYKKMEQKLKSKSMKDFKKLFSSFITNHHDELYENSPNKMIYYTGNKDKLEFINFIGISESEAEEIIKEAYYFKIASFNPRAMKDPLTVMQLCLYLYCSRKKIHENLARIYLSFGPKVYSSIMVSSFREFTASESFKSQAVMNYTMQTASTKILFKKYGTVYDTIDAVGVTWKDTYKDKIKSSSDEDMVYIFQQLKDRIKGVIQSVASLYYDNMDKPDSIIFSSYDSYDDDNFHIRDTRSREMYSYIENTVNHLSKGEIDKGAITTASASIRHSEAMDIIEKIHSDQTNLIQVRGVIENMITVFYNTNDGDPRDLRFVNTATQRKPNSKDPYYLKMMEDARGLLIKNSDRYSKIMRRPASETAYTNFLITYYAIYIHRISKR